MQLQKNGRLARLAASVALFSSVIAGINFAPPAYAAAVTPSSTACATDGYCYAAFTTVGSGTWAIPANTYSIDVLAVGGGGGGTRGRCAYSWGTGGGGGGVAEATAQSVNAGATATITVGSGGAGSGNCDGVQGTAGGSSSVVVGGVSVAGNGGGSSPFSGPSTATTITSANGPSSGSTVINGTTISGTAGGVVTFDAYNCVSYSCNAGGGGGAGAAASGMNAGAGKVSTITGIRYGGGGAGRNSSGYGTADSTAGNGTTCVAAANYGGGGADCGTSAGAGGSGYVYVRYLPGPTATGLTDQTISIGQAATFSVTPVRASNLTGATFAYQWQSSTDGGTTWNNVASATSASYSTGTQSNQTASGTKYRAKITQTSTVGALTSYNYTAAATLTVNKLSQTISFPAVSAKTYGDAAFDVSATATSGLTVTFSSATTPVCTVAGATVTIVAAGNCTINANQVGDASYLAANQVQQSFTVNTKTLTITANGDTKIYGATKTYGSGSIAFTQSGLVSGQSIGSVTITASGGTTSTANVGTYTLTPSAATGGTFVASNYAITYSTGNLVVSAATPTFTWANASTTYAPSGTYTLTAPTVTLGGTGTWSYSSGDTTVATVSSGATLNILKAGTSVVTATFTPSSSNFSSGATVTMTLTVGQAGNSITWLQSLPSSVYGSGSISLTAGATTGETITYSTNNTSICSVSGASLSLVGVGSCTVTANQTGNNNYVAASPVSKTFAITQAANSITLGTAPTGLVYGETGQTRTVTATATNGTIVFSTTSTACSVNSSTGVVTILAAGSCVISASAASVSGNYVTPAAQAQTLTIATAAVDAGTWSNASATYAPGATYVITPPTPTSAAVSGTIAGSWVYSSGNTSIATVASGATLNLLSAGSVVITGTFTPTNTSLASTTATFTLSVGQASNSITWSQSLGDVVYGSGSITLSATAVATGAVTFTTNNTSICSISGVTLSLFGVGACTVTAHQAGDTNYSAATDVVKTFNITQASNVISFGVAPTGLTYGETGQTRTVTATITNGSIAFSTGSTTCSVNANTGVVTILTAGACVISASATNVSGNYVTPTAQTQTLTIAQAANVITWSQTFSNVTFGASTVSLTATATNGAVSYSTSNSAICSVTGSTLTITGAGTCVVTADQTGSTNFVAASSVSKSFVVSQASNSISFGVAPTGLTYGETGQTRSVTATATNGTIVFSTSSSTCSVNSSTGVVTILAAGSCAIAASASNVSSSYLAPSTQTQTLTIGRAAVIAANWSNAATTYAPSATYTVTAPGVSSTASQNAIAGTWVFVSSDSTVAQLVSGAVFNILKPGSAVITGTFTPTDANFDGTTATFTLSVAQASNTINFGSLSTRKITSGTFSVSASTSSALSVTITSATPGVCSISGGTVTMISVGTCTLNANQSGNTYYLAARQVTQGFSVAAVTVTFDSNYGTSSTSTQSITSPSGAVLTANAFTRTGYSFVGWALASGGAVAYNDLQSAAFVADTSLYAIWVANNYGVTYFANNADGGAVPSDPTTYNIGQGITVRSNTGSLTRTGYTFGGWNTAVNGSGFTYNSGNTVTMGSQSVLLYAIWTANTYVITYNSNGASGSAQRGGNAVTADNYTTAGADVALPGVGTLALTGYTFGGWATAPSGGSVISGTYTTTANVTLYAKWIINVIAVNYNKGAASASTFVAFPANTAANYGTRVTLSGSLDTTVTIGGLAHTFVGWSDGTSIYRAGDTYLLGVNAVTFTAQWVQIFGVRYTFAGGTPAGSDGVTDAECLLAGSLCTNQQVIAANAAPTRAGYTFAGWVDQSGNQIAAGDSFTVSTGTYLLYATWQANDYAVSYAANGGSGSVSAATNYHYGDTLAVGAALSRTGYDFAGWSDGNQTYGSGAQYQVGLTAVSFTAVWTPHTYVVNFDWNGGTGSALNARSYTVGNQGFALPSPTNQVRDGYTFAGWSLTSSGALLTSPFSPTATETLYAIWATGSYSIAMDAGLGTTATNSLSIANGGSGTLPTATRNNFVFMGWFTAANGGNLVGAAGASFTPSSSATLYAHWVQSSLYGIAPGNLTRVGTINASPVIGSNFTGTSGQSGVSVSVPAGALPAGTVVNLDLIADNSYAQSLISGTNTYVLSIAVSWLALDGTVPNTANGKPVSLTLTNSAIRAGALVYSIQNGVATLLGIATADGTVTVTLTSDPGIYLVQTIANAPQNLVGVATQTSIDFTWLAPSNDGGSAITGYTVTLSNGDSCTTATLTCSFANLTAGTSYSVQVVAVNGVGNSSSATATVSTTSIPAPAPIQVPVLLVPSAPSGLSASASGTSITLTWSAPSNDGGSPITGYVVSSNGGLGCSTTGTSCVITGAAEGFAYLFFVTASNSVGASASSAGASVTTVTPIVEPTKPDVVLVSAPIAVVKVSPVTGAPVLAGVQVVKPILFNADSAKLDAGDLKVIATVLNSVQGQKGILLVTGFVKYSGRGNAAERALALARAKAVVKALSKFGVTVKIGYLGYGPQNKVTPKATDRKVEVRWVAAP